MKNTIVKFAVIMSFLWSFTANATLIEISGASDSENNGTWDISFVDGTFDTLSTTLMAQVWWNDFTLAGLFATTLEIGAGNAGSGLVGPDFAYEIVNATSYRQRACQTFSVTLNDCGAGGDLATFTDSRTRLFTYATATRVPEPTTAVLIALGLAGVSFSRKRKIA